MINNCDVSHMSVCTRPVDPISTICRPLTNWNLDNGESAVTRVTEDNGHRNQKDLWSLRCVWTRPKQAATTFKILPVRLNFLIYFLTTRLKVHSRPS